MDYDSLTQNLALYSDHLLKATTYSPLLKLNRKLIAGLLFSKEQLARNSGIDFNIHILNCNLESTIPEYDYLDILGILIDNAFEATKKTGTIHLYIDSKGEKNIIKITNPGETITPEMSKQLFCKGYSTKGNSQVRGIGLYKLKSIVDAYQGRLYLYNENDINNTLVCFEIVA